MSSNEDILKAMAAEKQKILASAIMPQLTPNISDADIVKAHRAATQPGRGGQKIDGDSRMGAPTSGATLENMPIVDMHIPGLRAMLKADRR
jgi:hypothetical protein